VSDRRNRNVYHPLRELTLARAREFFREPEAIFWVYIFPLLLAVGLGIAFRSKPEEPVRVLVEEGSPAGGRSPREVAEWLGKNPRIQVEILSPEEAWSDLTHGRADLIVRAGKDCVYIYDPLQTRSVLAREMADNTIQGKGRAELIATRDQPIDVPGSRYIDFLIPGLIGMNIMGGGLWGVGFVIVDMRVRKLLKRFLATPMKKRHFLLSIMGSRMIFLFPEIVLLLLFGSLLFGVPIHGSIAALAGVVVMSALCFSGLGLLVATRAKKIETISGLLNLVMLPMWLLSGVFFSAERFPDVLQPVIQALPLTAANDALRAVMLDGLPLASQAGELLILATWGLIAFALSLRWFRWM